MSSSPNDAADWRPRAADKYLPVAVIASMTVAVLLLMLPMGWAVLNVCKTPGRCLPASTTAGATTSPGGPAASASASIPATDTGRAGAGQAAAAGGAASR